MCTHAFVRARVRMYAILCVCVCVSVLVSVWVCAWTYIDILVGLTSPITTTFVLPSLMCRIIQPFWIEMIGEKYDYFVHTSK